MKKTLITLAFIASSFTAFSHTAVNPFSQLTKSIEFSADQWIKNFMTNLTDDQQLLYLNLFILFLQQLEDSIESIIKCIQTIQSDDNLTKASEQLGMDLQQYMVLYDKKMRNKYNEKKSTPESIKKFEQQLEIKIAELVTYIYAIYYTKLYQSIETRNPQSLTFIFNKDGIIAPENRKQALPKPAI